MKNEDCIRERAIPLFSCGVEYENKLYLASVDSNELYEYDWVKNRLRYVLSFQNEKDMWYLYRTCILYEKKAWFIPQIAENIAIVNLETFQVEYIPLTYKWKNSNVALKCVSAGIYLNHYLYIVPYDIDCMMLIDMDNMDVKKIDDVSKEEEKYSDAFYYAGSIYCIPYTADNALKLDVVTGKIERIEWKFEKGQYSKAIVDYEEKTVWFTPSKARDVLKLNLRNGEWESIPLKRCGNVGEINTEFGRIINENVILFPFNLDRIIVINKNNHLISEYEYENNLVKVPFFKPIFSDKLYAIIEYSNLIFFYDSDKDSFVMKRAFIDDYDGSYSRVRKEKMRLKLREEGIADERTFAGLKEYLDNII